MDSQSYPPEYLNNLDIPGLPPHRLRLKPFCPVILLRNLDPSVGLCNGTRLRVLRISPRVLECAILGGRHGGETVLLPRVCLTPLGLADNAYGVSFRRTQFALRLAFALTIDKPKDSP